MPTVLLVDDEIVFKAVEGTCLRREPCRLVMAKRDAVPERADSDPPDLLIAAVSDDTSRSWLESLSRDTRLARLPMIVLDATVSGKRATLDRGAGSARIDVLRVQGGPDRPDYAELDMRLDGAIKHHLPMLARRPDRVAVSLPVWCEGTGVHATLKTKNISTSGLFLKTDRPLAPGERLGVRFHIPVEGMARVPIAGVCEVVRRVQAAGPPSEADADLIPGVGVRFLDLGEDGARVLKRFVTAAGGPQGPEPDGRRGGARATH